MQQKYFVKLVHITSQDIKASEWRKALCALPCVIEEDLSAAINEGKGVLTVIVEDKLPSIAIYLWWGATRSQWIELKSPTEVKELALRLIVTQTTI